MNLVNFDQAKFDRRQCLQVGALSLCANGFLGAANAYAENSSGAKVFDREKSCIFILLQGGASHIDLWDPKPLASREIRGPFEAINTDVDGIQFGELLTESAKVASELAVIRSVKHNFNNHIAGTYITLTGSDNQQNRDREAHSDDFPGPGAILNYTENGTPKVPRSISVPNWLSIPGPSNRMPGQYGGFLGSVYDPFLIKGDPNQKKYNPLSLVMDKEMNASRMGSRLSLSQQLDSSARMIEEGMRRRQDSLFQSAYDLVTDGRVRKALRIEEESNETRDRYGRNKYGQSLLMARRLVEAGVQYVSYNAFNQEWDTHGNLKNRYKQIVPIMDRGFAALVFDLKERGMLDKTMVINTGEFGRTPVMNNGGGRDHWPNVYSSVIAGGIIKRGITFGKSDNKGSEVSENAVSPADVLATMWCHLGIDPKTEIFDRVQRPFPVSSGRVLSEILA